MIALAGRFAVPPRRAPKDIRFHFVHGSADGVISAQFGSDAARDLRQLGANATFDLVPGLGHAIDARVVGFVLRHLA